jgi:serine/threonine-protein kinase
MTDATRREPFTAGDEFLQYRIHSLLGRGGHAYVYSGQHLYMERPVAIKVIPAPAEMNSDIYRRAQLEAKVLSQLEHPNVVKVYDAGVTDAGVIYIVMEMLEGWTLRSAIKSIGAFTVPETLHIGVQIASAVQVAHAQQAIHRDLKPENVFVLPGNVVKVLDFGITKLLGTNTTLTTQPHVIRGTPQYMSPEHMQGHAVTWRSDIYALGSVLYELLATTAPALVGLNELSSYAIGYSQIHRMPPRLDELSSEIPRYVARSIQRMLAKDPGERPASMQQVADELRHLQTRYVSDFPRASDVLRELWHAPLLEPQPREPLPSSTAAAIGTVVLPNTLGRDPAPSSPAFALLKTRVIDHTSPTPTAVAAPGAASASARAFPVSLGTPNNGADPPAQSPFVAARRAPDAMALRLSDRRSSSPAPVTLQRSRSGRARTPSHMASLVLVAVVLGSIIGYGALMSIRRVYDRSSNASHSMATAELPAPAASPIIASAPQTPLAPPPTATTSASAARPSNSVGAALANTSSMHTPDVASNKTALTPVASAASASDAAESDSRIVRVSKDAPQDHPLPKPNGSSTARSGKTPAAKERLIFGAEDLSW